MSVTVHGVGLGNNITFCDLPACVEYCAYLVLTGEHAGMVALTITGADNEDCNDTFYGCYNFSTFKWEVLIPNKCCYVCPPANLYLTFAGIQSCGCVDYKESFPQVNGSYKIPYMYWDDTHHYHLWELDISDGDFGYGDSYSHLNCTDFLCTGTYNQIIIDVVFYPVEGAGAFVRIGATVHHTPPPYYIDAEVFRLYDGGAMPEGFCFQESYAWDNEDTCPGFLAGDGTATIIGDDCSGFVTWEIGVYYSKGKWVVHEGVCYQSIVNHTSDSLNQPPNTSYWESGS